MSKNKTKPDEMSKIAHIAHNLIVSTEVYCNASVCFFSFYELHFDIEADGAVVSVTFKENKKLRKQLEQRRKRKAVLRDNAKHSWLNYDRGEKNTLRNWHRSRIAAVLRKMHISERDIFELENRKYHYDTNVCVQCISNGKLCYTVSH